MDRIEQAAKEAVQDHFQCNGKYPCEERYYCEFCNGHNSAFDCREDCGADDFNEGFFAGAKWRVNSAWHDASEAPELERDFIYEAVTRSGEVYHGMCRLFGDDEWEFLKECCVLERWAYVSDLAR